jgi:hypothetical protein
MVNTELKLFGAEKEYRMTREAELAVRRMFFLWNSRRIAGFHTDACTDDFILHRSDGTNETALMVEESARQLLARYPDIHTGLDEVVSEDAWVGVRVIVRGTMESEFEGADASGEPFVAQGLALFLIQDGKLAEEWATPDFDGLLELLGQDAESGPDEKILPTRVTPPGTRAAGRAFVERWRGGQIASRDRLPQDFDRDVLPSIRGGE